MNRISLNPAMKRFGRILFCIFICTGIICLVSPVSAGMVQLDTSIFSSPGDTPDPAPMAAGSLDSPVRLGRSVTNALYAFEYDPEQGSWVATNYGQRTIIWLDGQGSVGIAGTNGSWSLQLSGLRRDNLLLPVGTGHATALGQQLEIIRPGYTEWYLNSNSGIEQGMTFTSRPAGTGSLSITFDLAGSLSPASSGFDILFSDQSGPVFRYTSPYAKDAAGQDVPVTMRLYGSQLVWVMDDSAALYPVTIDPVVTQLTIIRASDRQDGDCFGTSVAISGDMAIVGARNAASGGSSRGEAYIFQKDQGGTGTWGQVAILSASDKANNAYFGWSVAISGNTAVVGATQAVTSGTGKRGQAYIFQRDQGGSGSWGQVAILSASDTSNNAQFGATVAIAGDTVIVGAPFSASGGINRGQAYVFQRDQGGPGSWGQVTILSASDKNNGDCFGSSVSIYGDTVIIGAPFSASGGMSRGRVYVFEKNAGSAGTWSQVQVINASDQQDGNCFGTAVTISGDTVIASSPNAASGGVNRGETYIFGKDHGGPGSWGQVTILSASDKNNGDCFGTSVAISGDTAIVGAPNVASGGTYRGQVYIFQKDQGSPGTWGQVTAISASDKANNAQFGTSVAIAGNLAVVGASSAPSGGILRGQGYIFGVAPAVIGIDPASGSSDGGTVIMVTGTGFTGATGVRFGETNASGYTVDAATRITAISPAGTTGTVDITVTSAGGISAPGVADQFTYTEAVLTPTPTPTPAPTETPMMTSTITMTPLPQLSQVNPGDSSGSGVGGQTVKTVSGVPAGQVATFSFNQTPGATRPVALNQVQLTFNRDFGTAEVTGMPVTGRGSPPGQAVVGYLEITPNGINGNAIDAGIISFSVHRPYLSNHHLDPAQIVLMQNHDVQWTALPTTLIRQDGDTYYYEATTPGFSYFAVVVQAPGPAENITDIPYQEPVSTALDPIVTAEPARLPATPQVVRHTVAASPVAAVTTAAVAIPAMDSPGIPVMIIPGIIAITGGAAVIILFRRWLIRRQNPALFRDFK